MRHVITSLLVVSCVSSTALAFQARSDGAAAGKARIRACSLLTRDLAMKVSSAAGRTVLESATPTDDTEGMAIAKGASACSYGLILLILDPFAQPERIRKEMRTRTPIYRNHEPVSGVGDEAFFESNSAFANLYVWTGSRHFTIQMSGGFDEDEKALKPNAVALASAIIPQLR